MSPKHPILGRENSASVTPAPIIRKRSPQTRNQTKRAGSPQKTPCPKAKGGCTVSSCDAGL
jgi:hypothetical protein